MLYLILLYISFVIREYMYFKRYLLPVSAITILGNRMQLSSYDKLEAFITTFIIFNIFINDIHLKEYKNVYLFNI